MLEEISAPTLFAVTGDLRQAPQRRAGRLFVAVMFHTDQVVAESRLGLTPPARGGKHRLRRFCLCHTIRAADGGKFSVNHCWQGGHFLHSVFATDEGNRNNATASHFPLEYLSTQEMYKNNDCSTEKWCDLKEQKKTDFLLR